MSRKYSSYSKKNMIPRRTSCQVVGHRHLATVGASTTGECHKTSIMLISLLPVAEDGRKQQDHS